MNINLSTNMPNGVLAANRHNSPLQANNRAAGAVRNFQRFQSANHNAVEVNISEEAQRMFMKMQDGNGDLATRLQEFIEKESASLAPPLTFHEQIEALRQAHSNEAWEFLRQAHFANGGTAGSEFFSLDRAEMAEMGFQLLGVINFARNDVDNFAALGNRYAEMRKSLEARYSGEELGTQLNKLSEAFELTTEILGHERARTAWLRLHFENARIDAHNQMLNWNPPRGLFEGGRIEYDQEELSNIMERVTNGIRESVNHFAQMTRQFVLEKGAITERNNESLLALFRNTPAPQGGFSFDDLNSINEILRRPLGNGDAMRPPEPRSETIFTELGRILNPVN
jgi:hypothetical protein